MLLDTNPLNVQAYQALRDLIMKGKLSPGHRLDVEELAKQLGISTTPLKDALAKLAQEGFIEIRPRRGTFVAEVSWEKLEELFEVRMMIEQYTADAVVQNARPADVAQLQRTLDEMEALIDYEHDAMHVPEEWLAKDYSLHIHLTRLAGNERIINIYDTVKVLFVLFSDSHQHDTIATHQEHQAIVAAFEQRSVDEFRAALRQHLTNRRERWRQIFESEGDG